MKKIVSIMLALVMILSVTPVFASQQDIYDAMAIIKANKAEIKGVNDITSEEFTKIIQSYLKDTNVVASITTMGVHNATAEKEGTVDVTILFTSGNYKMDYRYQFKIPKVTASTPVKEVRVVLDEMAKEFVATNDTTADDVLYYVKSKLPESAEVWATGAGGYSIRRMKASETKAGWISMGIGVTLNGETIENYTFRQDIPPLGGEADLPFSDVEKGSYYEEAVRWAVNNKVTSGTSDTTFSPFVNCTRGQVVTFLWRAMGSPEPKTTKNPFTDVNNSNYYYKAVLWAVEQGITNGTAADAFSPDLTCSSGQVVTFLHRSKGSPKASKIGQIASQNPNQYFTDAVAWGEEKGLFENLGKTFAPNDNSPRADIVTYLFRCK